MHVTDQVSDTVEVIDSELFVDCLRKLESAGVSSLDLPGLYSLDYQRASGDILISLHKGETLPNKVLVKNPLPREL